ncbi:uncharacterized protein LOC143214603 [Lasioglossum baleicum]|uniref:uncharacterized protein LOC143214603 n=1 Tax=Lasioglossum baleicum TaxID=434251 RepID=UPI003FCE0C86
MDQLISKTGDCRSHLRRCVYKNCSVTNRNATSGTSFHVFPVKDQERCITWLVNCGLDDWVEENESFLKNKYVCSKHFNTNCMYASGRLMKTAIPNLYDTCDSDDASRGISCHSTTIDIELLLKEQACLKEQLLSAEKRIQMSNIRCENLRSRYRVKCKALERAEKKLSLGDISDSCLKKAVEKRVPKKVLPFILMQIFRQKRMYTAEEKELALSMHYTSPNLYRKMRLNFGFFLPNRTTTFRWFSRINIWPGISQELCNSFALKVSNMEIRDRNCVLSFDEMSIQKCFDFHNTKQVIEGFEDLGIHGRSSAVGTHVLIFMVRGLIRNWKQPFAFFVSGGVTKKGKLSPILDDILDALHAIGLRVRAIVSDQGTNFQSMSEERVSAKVPYFLRNGHKIFYIYDYLHLFKSIRNNLLKYDFSINGSRVSWSDVVSLWNLENSKLTRAAYRLTEKHVRPNTFDRMKCKLALQVFSKRVSSAMLTAHTIGAVNSSTMQDTAIFFETLNDLFDNLNSKVLRDPNPNKRALSASTDYIVRNLEKQLHAIENWKVITPNGYKAPPCFVGLYQSVGGTVQLWRDLENEGIPFLLTSRLNSDIIETFISIMRMHCGTYNRNPSVKTVRQSFSKNSYMNLNYSSPYANNECDDDVVLLQEAVVLAEHEQASAVNDAIVALEDERGEEHTDVTISGSVSSSSFCTLENCAIEYFAGYVAKKCTEVSKCPACLDFFVDSSNHLTRNEQLLISFRSYLLDENIHFGNLVVPTGEFSKLFNIINTTFDKYYPRIRCETQILDKLFRVIVTTVEHNYPSWFVDNDCAEHRKAMVFFFMKVKIHKDTQWMGQKVRCQSNQRSVARLQILKGL